MGTGSSTSSSQGTAAWVYENVLFLDPNAPPFISQAEYEKRLAREQNEEAGEANALDDPYDEGGRRAVRRTVPDQTKLRTRSFRVMVDINGRQSEFHIKCLNHPLSLVLCDRQGHELRSLPVAYLKEVERNQNVILCRFKIPTRRKWEKLKRKGTDDYQASSEPNEEHIVLSLTFFDANDTQGFVDTIQLLYGIYVSEYGVSKRRPEPAIAKSKLQKPGSGGVACSIHGNVPCNCVPGRLPHKKEANEEDAEHVAGTKEYPVTISGKLEPGNILRWSDISALAKMYPPKAVEWRVSFIPGKDPEFTAGVDDDANLQEYNTVYDNTLLVTEEMVGKYIQVKVTRRIKETSKRSPVIYSVAIKGPVTVNDKGARDVLEIITNPAYFLTVEMDPSALVRLFPVSTAEIEHYAELQPYLEVSFGVTRQGLSFTAAYLSNDAVVELPWNVFYASRLDPSQSDLGNEEDLYLQLHLRKSRKREVVFRIATPSQEKRNALYNAIYFFKFQKDFRGFDRWSRDLSHGNFAVFKERYAKLWASISFYDDLVDTLELCPLLAKSSRRTGVCQDLGDLSQADPSMLEAMESPESAPHTSFT